MENLTDFEKRFYDGLKGLHAESSGFCYSCPDCMDALGFNNEQEAKEAWQTGQAFIEPSFSWSSCELCGCSLGGDREPAHALDEDNEIIHFDICRDCVLYMANGDLPEE